MESNKNDLLFYYLFLGINFVLFLFSFFVLELIPSAILYFMTCLLTIGIIIINKKKEKR